MDSMDVMDGMDSAARFMPGKALRATSHKRRGGRPADTVSKRRKRVGGVKTAVTVTRTEYPIVRAAQCPLRGEKRCTTPKRWNGKSTAGRTPFILHVAGTRCGGPACPDGLNWYLPR